MLGMWIVTHESLLALTALVAFFRCAGEKGAETPDQRGMLEFVFLVIALGSLCLIQVNV
jgi:hypothetical protein